MRSKKFLSSPPSRSFWIFNPRILDESTKILLEAADLELIVDIWQPNFEGCLISERGFLEVLGLMQSIKMFEILDGNLRNQIKLLPTSLSKIHETFLHRILPLLITVTIKALFLHSVSSISSCTAKSRSTKSENDIVG